MKARWKRNKHIKEQDTLKVKRPETGKLGNVKDIEVSNTRPMKPPPPMPRLRVIEEGFDEARDMTDEELAKACKISVEDVKEKFMPQRKT